MDMTQTKTLTEQDIRQAIARSARGRDFDGETGIVSGIDTDGETIVVLLLDGDFRRWADILDVTLVQEESDDRNVKAMIEGDRESLAEAIRRGERVNAHRLVDNLIDNQRWLRDLAGQCGNCGMPRGTNADTGCNECAARAARLRRAWRANGCGPACARLHGESHTHHNGDYGAPEQNVRPACEFHRERGDGYVVGCPACEVALAARVGGK